MNPADYIFFVLGGISALAVAGTYVIYPAVMSLLASVKKKPWKKDVTFRPPVTIVVAAHNEEDVIEDKLRNFTKKSLHAIQISLSSMIRPPWGILLINIILWLLLVEGFTSTIATVKSFLH